MRVVFADGEVRDVDMEPVLDGPVFEPLHDPRSSQRSSSILRHIRSPGRPAQTSIPTCSTTRVSSRRAGADRRSQSSVRSADRPPSSGSAGSRCFVRSRMLARVGAGAPTNPFLQHELRVPRLTADEAVAIARRALRRSRRGARARQPAGPELPHRRRAAGRFVLKISNPAFAREELDLQNRAMEHVAARLPEVVPVAVRGADGHDIVRGGRARRAARHVPAGEELRSFDHLAPAVLRAAGELVGRITRCARRLRAPRRRPDPAVGRDRARSRWWRRSLRTSATRAGARCSSARWSARRARSRRSAPEPAPPGDPRRRERPQRPRPPRRRRPPRPPRPCSTSATPAGRGCAAECAVLAVAVACRDPDRVVQDAAEAVRGFHAALRADRGRAGRAARADGRPRRALRRRLRAAGRPRGGQRRTPTEGAEDAWHELAAVSAVAAPVAHAAFRAACGHAASSPRRACHAAGRSLPGSNARRTTVLDLSTRTDAVAPGGWRERRELAAVVRATARARPPRRGADRPRRRRGARRSPRPSTSASTSSCRRARRARARGRSGAAARARASCCSPSRGGLTLRLAGLVPEDARRPFAAGARSSALVALPRPATGCPAHLHVQLAAAALEELPGLVPASLAAAWLARLPRPRTAARPRRGRPPAEPPDAVLARRRRAVASPQRLYFPDDPPQIERGWRQWLYDVARPPLPRHGQQRRRPRPRASRRSSGRPPRQLRRLNTNSRFLYDALGRFAERLAGARARPARGRLLRQLRQRGRRPRPAARARDHRPARPRLLRRRLPRLDRGHGRDRQAAAVGPPDRAAAPATRERRSSSCADRGRAPPAGRAAVRAAARQLGRRPPARRLARGRLRARPRGGRAVHRRRGPGRVRPLRGCTSGRSSSSAWCPTS